AETYIWLAMAIFIVLVRFTSRIIQVRSVKNLQLEDGLMGLVLIFYILMTVATTMVDRYGSNEVPLDESDTIEAASIPDRVLGSKWVIVGEQMWLATIWGCKACLLLLYNNMTTGLTSHRFVLAVSIFCAVSYVLIQILFFGVWCRPFHDYWAVPATTTQCSVYTNHLILVLSLNVFSDLVMLFIPLPLLLRAKLSPGKKLTLCAVFSLGIFVIIASVMSKYYSLSEPYGSEWRDWYLREAGTAVIVANIPQTWPLLRRIVGARSFFSSGGHTYSRSRSRSRTWKTKNTTATGAGGVIRSLHSATDSTEYMAPVEPLQIWEQKQFHISEE
ncbi:hypothetical protein ASPZODRAFT_53362, partial [Penicilliopsis zonata CBS 506.65]